MASKSETGHDVNVANLGVINAEVAGMGLVYDPANPAIKVLSLTAKKTACDTALAGVQDGKNLFRDAVNVREIAYKGMNKYATRVFGALQGSGVSPESVRDAKGILNRLRGTRTTKVKEPTPENPDPKSISVSQLSYVNKRAHFADLVGLVKTESKYNPNEADLKVTALEAYIASLISMGEAVEREYTNLSGKMDERNVELYAPVTGLSELVGTVKAYVKSVLGASDPLFKRINGIKITKPKGF
jgi:hypothetical protein